MEKQNLTIRVETELKKNFYDICEQYGLTAPQALRLLMIQTVNTGKIPLTFEERCRKT